VIPGPRPPKGHNRPSVGRDRGSDTLRPVPIAPREADVSAAGATGAAVDWNDSDPPVSLVRTPNGWSVQSPAGVQGAGDMIEGLTLADFVAEEFGVLAEPDRTARRSARGTSPAVAEALDPTDARIAALERTVAQLEHALAARVATERAIGVLAERHGSSARAAFETMRRDARSQGRPVAELAREVLDGLTPEPAADPAPAAAPDGRSAGAVVTAVSPPAPRTATVPQAAAAADGRS
jgi:ANTAR domain